MNVRQILNIDYISKYRGEGLRDSLEKTIYQDEVLAQKWDNITRNMTNQDLKATLKQQIIKKWIDIRANSFVKCYIQVIKRKLAQIKKKKSNEKLSTASEPALRKTLF